MNKSALRFLLNVSKAGANLITMNSLFNTFGAAFKAKTPAIVRLALRRENLQTASRQRLYGVLVFTMSYKAV